MAARWITIFRVPFDYEWPGRSAVTCYSAPGEYYVKAEVADAAVPRYATEGKASEPKPATTRRRRATPRSDAANPRPAAPMDRKGVAVPDLPDDFPPVDDAGQRQ